MPVKVNYANTIDFAENLSPSAGARQISLKQLRIAFKIPREVSSHGSSI